MKLGNYIVIGGIAYLAYYLVVGRKKEEEISGDIPFEEIELYDDYEQIQHGNGVIEYRSADGRKSTVNTRFNRKQDGTREFFVGDKMVSSTATPPVTPSPSSPSSLNVDLFGGRTSSNSYTSINGNGRSVSF